MKPTKHLVYQSSQNIWVRGRSVTAGIQGARLLRPGPSIEPSLASGEAARLPRRVSGGLLWESALGESSALPCPSPNPWALGVPRAEAAVGANVRPSGSPKVETSKWGTGVGGRETRSREVGGQSADRRAGGRPRAESGRALLEAVEEGKWGSARRGQLRTLPPALSLGRLPAAASRQAEAWRLVSCADGARLLEAGRSPE